MISSFGSGGESSRRGLFASFAPRSFASLKTRFGSRCAFDGPRPEQANPPASTRIISTVHRLCRFILSPPRVLPGLIGLRGTYVHLLGGNIPPFCAASAGIGFRPDKLRVSIVESKDPQIVVVSPVPAIVGTGGLSGDQVELQEDALHAWKRKNGEVTLLYADLVAGGIVFAAEERHFPNRGNTEKTGKGLNDWVELVASKARPVLCGGRPTGRIQAS